MTDHDHPRTILNLCSGTGAIALGLAKLWPESQVIGVDNNERAVMTAEFNCRLNGIKNVQFLAGDLFGFKGTSRYDLIVADPPYSLHPVAGSLRSYSAGGKFGDEVIRQIIPHVAEHLNPGGRFTMLAYSLGDHGRAVRLEELVRQNLGELIPGGPTCLTPVEPAKMKVWRYKNHKCMPNPMPVEYMIVRCFDKERHPLSPGADEYKEIEIWIQWIDEDLKGKGKPQKANYTHLHYVVLDHCAGGSSAGDKGVSAPDVVHQDLSGD